MTYGQITNWMTMENPEFSGRSTVTIPSSAERLPMPHSERSRSTQRRTNF